MHRIKTVEGLELAVFTGEVPREGEAIALPGEMGTWQVYFVTWDISTVVWAVDATTAAPSSATVIVKPNNPPARRWLEARGR